MDFAVIVCTILATALNLNTLSANFAYDDSRAIQKNPDLRPESPIWNLFYNDFWGTPMNHSGSHKSYRPLCVLTFRLNYVIGQLDPKGYHLGNVICHALTTAVFTILARKLTQSDVATLCAGLLFASHPIHTEAVAGIVGRADILACLFFLLAFLSYMAYVRQRSSDRRGTRWCLAFLVMLLTAAGMVTKEQALTVLGVCAVYDLCVVHRASVHSIITFKMFREARFFPALEGLCFIFVCGSGLLAIRLYFMGNKPPEFAPSDNPASDSDSLMTRTLTYFFLPALNFWMLLCPKVLSFDWSMESIPLIESVFDIRNMGTVSFYCFLVCSCYFVYNRLTKETAFEASSSNSQVIQNSGFQGGHNNNKSNGVNINNNNVNGNHVLPAKSYTSSRNLTSHVPPTSQFHSSQHTRNSCLPLNEKNTYSTDPACHFRRVDVVAISLAVVVLPFIPATNLFFYVGFVVAERILYIPSMGFCLLMGVAVDMLYEKYISDQKRRRLLSAVFGVLILCFCFKTVLRNRDWQTEERLYTSGIAVNPPKAWGNLANIFNDGNRTADAEKAYRSALSYRPNMADVHYNLGILLQNQNRNKEAVESYKNAISFRPKLTVAHLNLGILTATLGDVETAKKIYSHCAALDTSGLKDPRLHDGTKISCIFNHGRLLMDQERNQDALDMFHAALKRRPDHYPAQSIYNMIGEINFKASNLAEAEHWYKLALKAKPDHIPAFLTMAKLMQAKGQHEETLLWYQKAKEVNPHDVTTDFHIAQYFAASGQLAESVKIYQSILPRMQHDFEVVYNAANVFRESGDNQKAEELYILAAKIRPWEATAHMNLGAIYHMNMKYDKAERSYLEALRLQPDSEVTKQNLNRLKNLGNRKQ